MPDNTVIQQDRELLKAVITRETDFINARMKFAAKCKNKYAVIETALQDPAERGTALRLMDYLTVQDKQRLFPLLLELASVGHSDIELCRDAILSLPRAWLLDNIEQAAAPILEAGSAEEYRRLLELYSRLDRQLTGKLALQAAASSDPDIKEAGNDFLEA